MEINGDITSFSDEPKNKVIGGYNFIE